MSADHLLDAVVEMTEHANQINLPDNDQQDALYHSTRAICAGLSAILEELLYIKKELESRS